MNKKMIVIVSHPIQYHAVLWRYINTIGNLDLVVYFCSDHGQKISLDKEFGVSFKWDTPLKDGYVSKTFKNYGVGKGFFKYINPKLLIDLLFTNNDVVYFHGVNNFSAYIAFWVSKFKGTKTIIRNISHLLDEKSNTKKYESLRDFIFGSVYRKANVCLYIGEHNKAFYEKFKVKKINLKHAPHIVDNDFFQKRVLNKQKQIELKKTIGISIDTLVILFCGKLIPKKQPNMLLDAFSSANLKRKVVLLFVGDGLLRAELENKALELKSSDFKSVKFLGFKNQSELPAIYSITDILVLPSYHQETWGLVVNEALNFSSSIIVSDNVGCGPDLVKDKTGYIFDRNNQKELSNTLEQLVNSEDILTKFKNNSLPTINNWGITEFIKSLNKVINEEN